MVSEELTTLFKEADECVLVDFQGLTVEEINALRASLTENNIHMQVVKTSIANIALKELDFTGYEEMLAGPIAVVWGGDGIVQVSKSVNDFTKKSKKLKIKGGFLEKKGIDLEAVKKLTTVPDRPILLGSLISCFMDPLQGIASGVNSMLSSIAQLINAVQEKKGSEDGGGEGG
jgi:large subunit ribosomal protein L10